jgi:hypothetical protein
MKEVNVLIIQLWIAVAIGIDMYWNVNKARLWNCPSTCNYLVRLLWFGDLHHRTKARKGRSFNKVFCHAHLKAIIITVAIAYVSGHAPSKSNNYNCCSCLRLILLSRIVLVVRSCILQLNGTSDSFKFEVVFIQNAVVG